MRYTYVYNHIILMHTYPYIPIRIYTYPYIPIQPVHIYTYLCTSIHIYTHLYIIYIHTYRQTYIHTSRARASRVTEVWREGRTYKDKGEPVGTTPDRLAGTAVASVISWKSLSLAFLTSRHLCLMLPLFLDLACS